MSAPLQRGFYYALYNYQPHRVELPNIDEHVDKSSESVASFLRKEAVVDGDFSLTCSRHSLDSPAVETQLRDAIARRLSRGAVYSGSGNVLSVDIKDLRSPLACYFVLLRTQPVADSGPPVSPSSQDYVRRREYVVCYLTDREEVDLLPFRAELDSHALQLQQLLYEVNPGDSSQVPSDVVFHLQQWQKTCLYFVTRCVDRVGLKLPALLYASLCCLPMEITSASKACTQEDLRRFTDACSLTALMQAQLQTTASTTATAAPQQPQSLIDFDLLGDVVDNSTVIPTSPSSQLPANIVTVHATEDECSVSSTTTNFFCEEWAVALRSVPDKDNPSVLRQIVENFKLKAIQHMNTLKRLLRNAETDHYTLYRAFVFLETCGMGEVLLSAASKDAEDASSPDSHEVCKVLREFMHSLPVSAHLESKDTPPVRQQDLL